MVLKENIYIYFDSKSLLTLRDILYWFYVILPFTSVLGNYMKKRENTLPKSRKTMIIFPKQWIGKKIGW